MEPLDLKALVGAAQDDLRVQKCEEIKRKIAQIIGRRDTAEGSLRKLQQDVKKAEVALAREQAKLQRLEAGDWTVLDGAQEDK